jgi:hypothetical protein
MQWLTSLKLELINISIRLNQFTCMLRSKIAAKLDADRKVAEEAIKQIEDDLTQK